MTDQRRPLLNKGCNDYLMKGKEKRSPGSNKSFFRERHFAILNIKGKASNRRNLFADSDLRPIRRADSKKACFCHYYPGSGLGTGLLGRLS